MNRDIIRQMHAETPPRPADDPLREFLSMVIVRDSARTLFVRLRRLHVGERIRRGDLVKTSNTGLFPARKLWWRRWPRVQDVQEIYRIE